MARKVASVSVGEYFATFNLRSKDSAQLILHIGAKIRDIQAGGLKIDRWTDPEAYRAFRAEFAEPYAALDRTCEELTTRKSALGEFELARSG